MPVTKHRFTSLDNHSEKKFLKVFNKNTGIPLGPSDFLRSNASMIFEISSGTVGLRKNEQPSGLMNTLPFLSFLFK